MFVYSQQMLNALRPIVLSDADKLFEHDLGALNMAALNRRVERAGLLSNLGPCCKALCARRDFAIRRQLLKNDKVADRLRLRFFFYFSLPFQHPTVLFFVFFYNDPVCLLQGLTKQYPVTPVVDSELLQMSMRLFRRTMAAQASGPERPDAAVTPAAEAAATVANPDAACGSSKLSTAQPEVCVS